MAPTRFGSTGNVFVTPPHRTQSVPHDNLDGYCGEALSTSNIPAWPLRPRVILGYIGQRFLAGIVFEVLSNRLFVSLKDRLQLPRRPLTRLQVRWKWLRETLKCPRFCSARGDGKAWNMPRKFDQDAKHRVVRLVEDRI